MDNKLAIGIDVGSTNFRLGVVSSEGKILSRHLAKIGLNRRPEHIVQMLSTHVAKFKNEYPDIVGVGAGLPGIVDHKAGIVHQAPHHPGWKDVRFREILSEAFDLPVVIDNDVNMIALGESWLGAGRGMKNFLMITLGTGIGGGIVCDGSLCRGDRGFAGEFGHILIDYNGPVCNCGGRGCFEMYASATGLKELVKNSDGHGRKSILDLVNGDYDKLTPELLFNAARDGNIFASTIWKKFGAYLGAGIASLVNTLGVMNVVIGGGIVKAWDFFIPEAKRELKKRTYRETAKRVKLTVSELGDHAGIYGSAMEFVLETS